MYTRQARQNAWFALEATPVATTFRLNVACPKGFIEEEEAAMVEMATKSAGEMFGLGNGQSMRAEDAEHCASKRAFACAFVALENEDGLANLAGMLKSVSEPADDVAPSFAVACAKYTVDMITHQLPTALAWEYSKTSPEVEAVVGKDFGFVGFESDAVVGYSAGMAEPEAACGDFV